MNRNHKVVVSHLLLLAGFLGLAMVGINQFQSFGHVPRSNEPPFNLMKLPLRDVDASTLCAFGDQIRGRRAMLIKVTDSDGLDSFFAVLNEGRGGKCERILKYLDMEWDRTSGFGSLRGCCESESVPDVFFDQPHRFESVENPGRALKDLVRMLRDFYPGHSSRSRIALESITGVD